MEWTTATPEVTGWYWFRRFPGAVPECVLVIGPEYVTDDDELRVVVCGWDDYCGIRDYRFNPGVGQWAGPIKPPGA